MRGTKVLAVTIALLLALAGSPGMAAGKVDVSSLLDEMTNLQLLAEYPDPPFICKQFSSYDPKSKTPDDHDAWFANADHGQYIRIEARDGRTEYVMMDAEGPGAIVRIWSANADGDLRIYIDGADAPALEMNMQQALDGQHAPFLAPIAGVHSRGWNLYFPFPYAKRCKVTTTAKDIYYHVNHRTYPPGTEVASFARDQIEAAKDKVAKVRQGLERPFAASPVPADAQTQQSEPLTLSPGASQTTIRLEGPAALYEAAGTIKADNLRDALRCTIVQITFDDASAPSVNCPFGDLFGTSPDANAYESLPIKVEKSGLMSLKWVMPFEKSCEVTLVNMGRQPVEVSGSLTAGPYKWTDRSMHFNAKWRAERRMPTRPFRDWTYVKANGRGVFVGDMLSVTNDVKGWWGEGDEKIYVDAEKFPSHFGTGSEDYYGYAWCSPELFTHAYHNQTRCDGPNNYGFTSVNRFHILDKIPFTKQFQFDIEVWHSAANQTVTYSATSYWYARPGATDFFKPLAPEDLEIVAPKPPAVAQKVKGALEGETLKIVRKSGEPEVQDGFDEIWSGGKQIWWKGSKPGEALVLALPVKEAGRYKVSGNFTRAIDYGIIQLYINGQKSGEPMDFFKRGDVGVTGRKDLGAFDLKAGDNELTAEIVGKNDRAVPNYMFGIDYMLLEKQ
jgi:hypothetical protein